MSGKTPIRHCMGCNGAFEKTELLRLCREKGSQVTYDPTSKAQGRGAYLCKNSDCLKRVQKSRRFNKVFKCQVDDEVYRVLSEIIEQRGEI